MFLAALASGNLERVRRLAAEMPAVGLADAVHVVALIQRDEPQSFERAAVRWLARYAAERARTVGDIGAAVDGFDLMRASPEQGRAAITALCVAVD
jgi:hypothetical protein